MRKEFFGHAGRLFSWTIAGQVIGLLSAPIVARLYGPEAYGIAAMVLTTGGTVAIISSFRYEQAIVVADDEVDAHALQRLCRNAISIVALVTTAVCLALYVYPPAFVDEFFEADRYLLFGIPLIAALNAYANVRRLSLNRNKEYARIGIAKFSNSIVVPLSRIASGLIFYGNAFLLVISMTLGWLTEVLLMRPKRSRQQQDHHETSRKSLRGVARRYRDFPTFSLPEGLVSSVSVKLPIYTLGFIYDPAVTGLYALASRVVNVPVAALSTAVSQVLLRQFEEQKRKGIRLVAPLAKSTLGLFAVSLLIGVPIMLFAEPVFLVLFGDDWATTGKYAATLVPWIVSAVAVIPTNLTFIVLRRQGVWLLAQVGLLILRVLIIAGAVIYNLDVLTTLWTFTLTSAAYFFMICVGTLYVLSREKSPAQ